MRTKKEITTCLLLVVIIANGCFFPRDLKNSFQKEGFCFNDKNTGLDTMIKLNGYYEFDYEFPSTHKETINGKLKSSFGILFFANGFALNNFFNTQKGFLGAAATYSIRNDTIRILNTCGRGCQLNRAEYSWLRVINNEKLEYLAFSYVDTLSGNEMNEFKKKLIIDGESYTNGRFIKLDSLPDQQSFWIKKKKWFWCDENEYKNWKKSYRKR